jgi:hypothetical protein
MQFHVDSFATRLGKLAEGGRTGALHISGDLGGVVYFRDGDVIYAESARTPGPASLPGPLGWALAVRESTVDAAFDLLSDTAHPATSRFRNAESPGVGEAVGIPVDTLLAEVARRREVCAQLSAALTADTAVIPNPHLAPRGVHVSTLQWAVLIRVGDQSTPRSLAFELQRSVFGTVLEVFRLVSLGLLTVADDPDPPAGQVPGQAFRRDAVSFVQAVTQRRAQRLVSQVRGCRRKPTPPIGAQRRPRKCGHGERRRNGNRLLLNFDFGAIDGTAITRRSRLPTFRHSG